MALKNLSSDQKILGAKIARDLEASGLSVQECVETLATTVATLVAYSAPTKEEMNKFIDTDLAQSLKECASVWFDYKNCEFD